MDRPQNFANHRANPGYLYLAAGVVILLETWHRATIAAHDPSFWNVWSALFGLALFIVFWTARQRALIVQNRVIRLEMTLRLERLFGAARRADIARLSLPQLVALRFASDDELRKLFEEVLAGALVEPKAIKLRVQNWQADWLRV